MRGRQERRGSRASSPEEAGKPTLTLACGHSPSTWARAPSTPRLSLPQPHCTHRAGSPPMVPGARTHLDSSPVASTPKCSHTAGQNCSRHVMKSSSRLRTRGDEPGARRGCQASLDPLSPGSPSKLEGSFHTSPPSDVTQGSRKCPEGLQ